MFRNVNRQPQPPLEIGENLGQTCRIAFHHVVANKTKISQLPRGRTAGGDHGLKMVEPNATVIIQAQKSRGLAPSPAQEGIQHEFVKTVVARPGGGAIPQRIAFVSMEESPVFGDPHLHFAAGRGGSADDLTGCLMSPGHMADYQKKLSQPPFLMRRVPPE